MAINKDIVIKARAILERGLIEQTTEHSYKVDGEVIINKGNDLSCTCTFCTLNKNKSVICHRKVAIILYECQDLRLKKLINDTSSYLEDCEQVNVNPEITVIRCLLSDLRRFI